VLVLWYLSGALDEHVDEGVDAAVAAVAMAVAVAVAAAVAVVAGGGVDAWLVQNHSLTTGEKMLVLMGMKMKTKRTPVEWGAKRGRKLGHQRALRVSAHS